MKRSALAGSRFGIATSATWATYTTAASNGSVNSMHDSYTPLGGMVPMLLMMLGEVIFGGTGCGLYGMLAFAILTVFIAAVAAEQSHKIHQHGLDDKAVVIVPVKVRAWGRSSWSGTATPFWRKFPAFCRGKLSRGDIERSASFLREQLL